jgi:hypothetical protein
MDAEAWNFWNDASLIGFVIAVGPEPLVGLPSLHCFNFNANTIMLRIVYCLVRILW